MRTRHREVAGHATAKLDGPGPWRPGGARVGGPREFCPAWPSAPSAPVPWARPAPPPAALRPHKGSKGAARGRSFIPASAGFGISKAQSQGRFGGRSPSPQIPGEVGAGPLLQCLEGPGPQRPPSRSLHTPAAAGGPASPWATAPPCDPDASALPGGQDGSPRENQGKLGKVWRARESQSCLSRWNLLWLPRGRPLGNFWKDARSAAWGLGLDAV